jgi:hypothetical protein
MANNLNFSLGSICKQRFKQVLYNIPPPRYETISPYDGTYTKEQLDMRRKAEVLKYNKNGSNFSSTKVGKWTQLVSGNSTTQKGSYPTINYVISDYQNNFQTISAKYPNTIQLIPTSQYTVDKYGNRIVNEDAYQVVGKTGFYTINYVQNDILNTCPLDNLIPTPTSSCDVPGPITYLIDDETVPLYNYATKTNSYANDTNVSQPSLWRYNPTNDIILTNINDTILTLLITDKIDKPFYTFSLQIPFSIYITGTNISATAIADPIHYPFYFPDLAIGINSIIFGVKYGDSDINFASDPIISISSNQTYELTKINGIYPVNNFNPLQFDISFSHIPTTSYDSYVAQVFGGIINISNIQLYTEPGYVYDFYLKINNTGLMFPSNNQNLYYNIIIQNTQYHIIVNSTNISTISQNTIVYPLNNIPIPTHSGIYVTGT